MHHIMYITFAVMYITYVVSYTQKFHVNIENVSCKHILKVHALNIGKKLFKNKKSM